MSVSLILLAGGTGSRFLSCIPKQYTLLKGEPLIFHSLKTFLQTTLFKEIIVVCDLKYRSLFQQFPVLFAQPGKTRQLSVLSGLLKASTPLIMIHDAARPLVHIDELQQLIEAAQTSGAAVLASPINNTVRQIDPITHQPKLLDRSTLYEIHTPQCIQRDILYQGLIKAKNDNILLTDDAAAAELLNVPITFIKTQRPNVKVTTPHDIKIVEAFLPT